MPVENIQWTLPTLSHYWPRKGRREVTEASFYYAMNLKSTKLVSSGFFQAIGLMLCFTSLWGLMNIFGGFPTQSESFTNEYGENITVYYGKFSFIIDVMIASFWIVVGFNCFKRNYKIAGIGTILRLIACCLSLINYWEYSRLSSSETDYYQAKQILGVCGIMGYA